MPLGFSKPVPGLFPLVSKLSMEFILTIWLQDDIFPSRAAPNQNIEVC
jgi:hypothetical protein